MNSQELLAEIAQGRTVAQRLPLYNAAMNLGLLTFGQIQQAVKAETKKPVAKRATKKAAAKKTEPTA